MLPQPCLEPGCRTYAYGTSRCNYHEAVKGRVKQAKRKAAGGDGAARRLREALNREGWCVCAACGVDGFAGRYQVDHIVALADGGSDVATNVQALCKACHDAKTAVENKRRRMLR